jgi:hypothetical protein
MSALAKITQSLGACDEWDKWHAKHAKLTLRQTWEANPRADWLLWYAERIGVDRKLLVRAACACARTALKHVPSGELRPLRAIDTAERWCDELATIDEVRDAADAAYAAAYAYDAAYTYASAYASASAAYAAYDTNADAVAAAYAAYAAAAYAAVADAASASASASAVMARLVRKHIPYAAVRKARLAYTRDRSAL